MRRRARPAQALVEFALAVPLLLLVLLALIDFSRLLFTYVSLADGAREMARVGALARNSSASAVAAFNDYTLIAGSGNPATDQVVVTVADQVAVVGLVVDAGNIYIPRRTGQNAADAAALAGARTLLYTTAPGQVGSISASIAQYATANAFGVQPSVPCAYFVDSTAGAITGAGIINDGSIPSCPAVSSSIPGTASGVHVDTRIAFPTYMMGMFNLMSETAESHATAQVGVLSAGDTRAAPLIACGGGGGTGYDALKLTTQTPVVVTTTPGVL